MKKFLKYLYYRLYCIWLKKKDEQKNAHVNAVITLTFLLYLNIVSIPLISLAVFNYELVDMPGIDDRIKILIILILIGTGLLNYFLFARKEQHQRIIDEFASESDKKRKLGTLIAIFYIVISLIVPIYIFLFTLPK